MNFSKLLRSVIPEKDFVGRYGGDEFIAILNNIDIEVIKSKIDDMKEKIEDYNYDKLQYQVQH